MSVCTLTPSQSRESPSFRLEITAGAGPPYRRAPTSIGSTLICFFLITWKMKAGAHPWSVVPLRKPGLGREKRGKVCWESPRLYLSSMTNITASSLVKKLRFTLTAVSIDENPSKAPQSAMTCRTLIRGSCREPFCL